MMNMYVVVLITLAVVGCNDKSIVEPHRLNGEKTAYSFVKLGEFKTDSLVVVPVGGSVKLGEFKTDSLVVVPIGGSVKLGEFKTDSLVVNDNISAGSVMPAKVKKPDWPIRNDE